jgi:NTE family protein
VATAFALSGGSIKGAFQAGALEVVLESGKVPSFISGISVGSLNAAWLANEAGRSPTSVDWPALGRGLTGFWRQSLKQPSDLVISKGLLRLGWELLRDRFEGAVDTAPLRALLQRTLRKEQLARCPIEVRFGTVDYYGGTIRYFGTNDPDVVDLLMGSSAIPVAMPSSSARGSVFYDGGVRDVAPLKPAMKSGAEEIVVIACQATKVLQYPSNDSVIDHRDLRKLAERVTDIMTNEIVNADIDYAEEINEIIRKGRADDLRITRGKTERRLVVIRPEQDLVADIENFVAADIENMIELGRSSARAAFGR